MTQLAVDLFRAWTLARPAEVDGIREELAGMDLVCWYPLELPCHADVLLALAKLTKPENHGQLCPLWAKKADIGHCDCWILRHARGDIPYLAPILIAEGRRQAAADIRFTIVPGALKPADIDGTVSDPGAIAEWAARIAEGTP